MIRTIVGFALGLALLGAVHFAASSLPDKRHQAFIEAAGLVLLFLSIGYVAASVARAKWGMVASACAGFAILPSLSLIMLSILLIR